jgi:hypothetical protein
MEDTYSMIPIFVSIAIETSISGCRHGTPFGGTYGWMFITIMSNDSGQYPWAPVQAAIIGFPITILCDITLMIPAIFIGLFLHTLHATI